MPQQTSPTGAKSITSIPGPPSNGAGPPMPADGTALTSTHRVPVKPARMTREPTFTTHQQPEPTTPEKGGAEHPIEVVRHALEKQLRDGVDRQPRQRAHHGAVDPNKLQLTTHVQF